MNKYDSFDNFIRNNYRLKVEWLDVSDNDGLTYIHI